MNLNWGAVGLLKNDTKHTPKAQDFDLIQGDLF